MRIPALILLYYCCMETGSGTKVGSSSLPSDIISDVSCVTNDCSMSQNFSLKPYLDFQRAFSYEFVVQVDRASYM